MDDFEVLAAKLDKLPCDPQAQLRYDLFAGGLVWSDETPTCDFDDVDASRFPPGHSEFRVLLHYRSSLILGQPKEQYRALWEKALTLCPNWPGLLPQRRDRTLAHECNVRSE